MYNRNIECQHQQARKLSFWRLIHKTLAYDLGKIAASYFFSRQKYRWTVGGESIKKCGLFAGSPGHKRLTVWSSKRLSIWIWLLLFPHSGLLFGSGLSGSSSFCHVKIEEFIILSHTSNHLVRTVGTVFARTCAYLSSGSIIQIWIMHWFWQDLFLAPHYYRCGS
jgi:hypothetical protein